VVVIASVLLLAGMRLMIARAESAQLEVTRRNQDAIKTALISYLGRTQRLPCPDTNLPPDGREDRNVAAPVPPCVAYSGSVPYLDLGLDRSAVLDGWENYMTYVVSASASQPVPTPATPSWTTSWVNTYIQLLLITDPTTQTSVGSLAFLPTVSTGGIVVSDVSPAGVVTPVATPASPLPNGAVVVVISYGKNGYGAINVNGTQNNFAGVGQDELTNITPAPPASPVVAAVINRDVSDQVIPGHGTFDDILLVLRQNDLVQPLVASGVMQTSSLPALNQANDYVTGLIVGNPPGRIACPSLVGQCTACTGFYYNLPNATTVTPGPMAITYTPTAANICSNALAPSTAYTLQSPDQSIRTVTNGEAIGAVGRVGGFN